MSIPAESNETCRTPFLPRWRSRRWQNFLDQERPHDRHSASHWHFKSHGKTATTAGKQCWRLLPYYWKESGILSNVIENPYCVVTMGGHQHQTQVDVRGGTTPRWHQTFRMEYAGERMMRFKLMDKDKLTKDDLIAIGDVALEPIVHGPRLLNTELELTRGEKKAGYLRVTVEFEPRTKDTPKKADTPKVTETAVTPAPAPTAAPALVAVAAPPVQYQPVAHTVAPPYAPASAPYPAPAPVYAAPAPQPYAPAPYGAPAAPYGGGHQPYSAPAPAPYYPVHAPPSYYPYRPA